MGSLPLLFVLEYLVQYLLRRSFQLTFYFSNGRFFALSIPYFIRIREKGDWCLPQGRDEKVSVFFIPDQVGDK